VLDFVFVAGAARRWRASSEILAAEESYCPCTEFIDHIVVDPRVLPWVDRSSFRQVTYRQADKAVWGQLSDHCPVLVELWIR
jgi:endonuclease/exonuclease/phosphatase family metal-dependent hydrolase